MESDPSSLPHVPPPGSMKAARVEEFDLIDVSASSQAGERV